MSLSPAGLAASPAATGSAGSPIATPAAVGLASSAAGSCSPSGGPLQLRFFIPGALLSCCA